MKNSITCFLLLTLFCFGKCNKEKNHVEGLPPATQEGRNTLGFLLDGQPWTPKGNVGATSNLTVDIDLAYNQGGFSISAYKTISSSLSESFGIGIKDSLKFMTLPITLPLNRFSLYGIRMRSNRCSYFSTDTGTYSSGSMTITKLDKTNRIIAGTFTATLYMPGCDTIRVTDGRFDMKN